MPDEVAVDARPGGRTILLVEDEEPIATMTSRRLRSLGYAVTMHVSSVDALEVFKSQTERYGLLLSDDNMPRMDGLTLAAEMLRIRPSLPVLLVSGLAETPNREELRAIGVRGCWRSPTCRACSRARSRDCSARRERGAPRRPAAPARYGAGSIGM